MIIPKSHKFGKFKSLPGNHPGIHCNDNEGIARSIVWWGGLDEDVSMPLETNKAVSGLWFLIRM